MFGGAARAGDALTSDFTSELRRLTRLLDEALRALRDRGRLLAERERDYRHARARAWLTVDGETAKQREDGVNHMTADERYVRDLADHDRQAALEGVRNYRVQISAMQSILALERAEAEFSRTGPQVTA